MNPQLQELSDRVFEARCAAARLVRNGAGLSYQDKEDVDAAYRLLTGAAARMDGVAAKLAQVGGTWLDALVCDTPERAITRFYDRRSWDATGANNAGLSDTQIAENVHTAWKQLQEHIRKHDICAGVPLVPR